MKEKISAETRKKAHDLLEACMNSSDAGNDAFFQYYGHVNSIDMEVHTGNYENNIILKGYFYLTEENLYSKENRPEAMAKITSRLKEITTKKLKENEKIGRNDRTGNI
ncbi:MAG: hypothetical protein LBE91_19005 [Tannerella sp.]|jgi:hypothetical protein|nr:hypothetical protein [Tannerella sp.]